MVFNSKITIINRSILLFFAGISLSIIFRVEEFDFISHYLSDLGLLFINGQPNTIGFIFFNFALIGIVFSMYFMQKLCSDLDHNDIIRLIRVFLWISLLSLIIMLLFPKDINIDAHFIFSIGIYIGYLPTLVLINRFIISNTENHGLSLMIGILIGILFALYFFADPLSLTPPLFQKIFLCSMALSFPYYAQILDRIKNSKKLK